MPARLPSFWLKVILAVGVVALADAVLFEPDGFGVNVALLLTAATAVLAIARPAVWRDRLGRIALAVAVLLALLPAERASVLAIGLWVLAVAVATLAPRAARGDDGWRWFQRLAVAGLKALIWWTADLRTLLKARVRSGPLRLTAVLLAAALPAAGGLIFLELFAAANPVIAGWQANLRLAPLDVGRIIFWLVIAFPMATILRPRGLRRTWATPGARGDLNLPGVTAASITLSLAVFNLIFALQNGLDIAFLWSGAGLPKGVSFADYAHRGAYPLIATALLAGLFVVVFLRPGSATAGRPLVRWLVIAWVAQNVFLVASTALRTLDYIDAYSLTRMRIAALLWMALVATGLVLILWRLLSGKSSSWLINANLLTTATVLALCSVVDLGALTAAWNVRHAREMGGQGVALDLCYMRKLNGAAVVSLAELERRPIPDELRQRAEVVRRELTATMLAQMSDWRGLRLRDQRRLSRLQSLGFAPAPLAYKTRQYGGPYRCDGSPNAPPAPPHPLTPAANPRT